MWLKISLVDFVGDGWLFARPCCRMCVLFFALLSVRYLQNSSTTFNFIFTLLYTGYRIFQRFYFFSNWQFPFGLSIQPILSVINRLVMRNINRQQKKKIHFAGLYKKQIVWTSLPPRLSVCMSAWLHCSRREAVHWKLMNEHKQLFVIKFKLKTITTKTTIYYWK